MAVYETIEALINDIDGENAQKYKVCKHLNPPGLDNDDVIVKVRVRNCWIGHGFWAFLGSIFTRPLAGSTITHWWVEIETEKCYYCAQFKYDILELTKHGSISEVTEEGKSAANCRGKEKNITTKYFCYPKNKKMKHIVVGMMIANGSYNLVTNNCQDFAKALLQFLEYN